MCQQKLSISSGCDKALKETPVKIDPNRAMKLEKLKQLQEAVKRLVHIRHLQWHKRTHSTNPTKNMPCTLLALNETSVHSIQCK